MNSRANIFISFHNLSLSHLPTINCISIIHGCPCSLKCQHCWVNKLKFSWATNYINVVVWGLSNRFFSLGIPSHSDGSMKFEALNMNSRVSIAWAIKWLDAKMQFLQGICLSYSWHVSSHKLNFIGPTCFLLFQHHPHVDFYHFLCMAPLTHAYNICQKENVKFHLTSPEWFSVQYSSAYTLDVHSIIACDF